MRLIDADTLPKYTGLALSATEVAKAVEHAPTIDAVPRKAFDRILWENDVMRKQLIDIGKPFGAKMDDVVKVVRCKDCKWHKDEEPGMVYCPNVTGGWVEDDWYCKQGRRQERR